MHAREERSTVIVASPANNAVFPSDEILRVAPKVAGTP